MEPALLISAVEATKPLSCTTDLWVSTVICATLSERSSKIAVFTFVVIVVSSMYSPVLSFDDVPAHPMATSIEAAMKIAKNRFGIVMSTLLKILAHLQGGTLKKMPGTRCCSGRGTTAWTIFNCKTAVRISIRDEQHPLLRDNSLRVSTHNLEIWLYVGWRTERAGE